jgi:hypothetical protein
MNNNKGILFLLSLIYVFSSCEKEYENHCNSDGPLELICKELRYEDGVLVEAVSYEYGNNDLVSLKLHENKSGRNIGQVTYQYDDENNLLSEVFKNSDKEILISNSWTYNEEQQVTSFKIEDYGAVQKTDFTYSNGLLIQEEFLVEELLKYTKEYKYFDNDTMSYNVSTFDVYGNLLLVAEYRQFDTSTKRIEMFDELGELKNYEVKLFDEKGHLVEHREYDNVNTLLSIKEYDYLNEILKTYRYLSNTESNKEVSYLRFEDQ